MSQSFTVCLFICSHCFPLQCVNRISLNHVHVKSTLVISIRIDKLNWHLLCRVYLFGTKHLLLHLVVVDIDVLDSDRLANETIFYGVKPFHVVMFPMDQGCNETKEEKKKLLKIDLQKRKSEKSIIIFNVTT